MVEMMTCPNCHGHPMDGCGSCGTAGVVPKPAEEAPQATGVEFPAGDFYDCADSEILSHTDPIDALVEHVENVLYPGAFTAARIREELEPVTVTAFRHTVVTEQDMQRVAKDLSERAEEFWAENCTGPDYESALSPAAVAAFEAAIQPALATLYSSQKPWRCDSCGSVVLSAEQVESILRDACPTWFDEEQQHAEASCG